MQEDCWYFYLEDMGTKSFCELGYKVSNCDEHCPVYKNMKACFVNSMLPKKYWYPFSLKKSDIDKGAVSQITEIRDDLDKFVSNGRNLLLQSSKCGNGKTCWGVKLLQKQIEHHYKQSAYGKLPACFIYVPSMLIEARKSIKSVSNEFQVMQYAVENCPLVMFDDIGCIPLKDYDLLLLSNFIETRINNEQSCIFTTNCEDEALKANLGERLYDRIHRLSKIITFKSNSMRGTDD